MTSIYFNTSSSSFDSSEETKPVVPQNPVYSTFMPSSDSMCTMAPNSEYRSTEVKSVIPERPSHLPSLIKQGDYK